MEFLIFGIICLPKPLFTVDRSFLLFLLFAFLLVPTLEMDEFSFCLFAFSLLLLFSLFLSLVSFDVESLVSLDVKLPESLISSLLRFLFFFFFFERCFEC